MARRFPAWRLALAEVSEAAVQAWPSGRVSVLASAAQEQVSP